jgi:hypothetical protein
MVLPANLIKKRDGWMHASITEVDQSGQVGL